MLDTMTETNSITQQRKQLILNFIHEYRRLKSISPSYEEIAQGCGFSGKSEGHVYMIIDELVQEGWLKRTPRTSRSLVPLKPADEQYCPISKRKLRSIAKQQPNLRIMRDK